jgi:microsomal dipeptidase-like Zn-dependent dipeptidase
VDEMHRYDPAEVLSNLDKVQQKVKILAINLTHLQQSSLCNQAFGMQVADSTAFFPSGNGLQNDGRKVIQGFFDRKICLDVKHMSYKSRKDVMTEIDAKKFTSVQPLVCTHAGFTGMSFKDWAGNIQLKKPLSGAVYLEITKKYSDKTATFNASTINLFNEEIVWIVKNGGVIGLSMDRRILGYVDKFDDDPTGISGTERIVDKEFFSKTEWLSFNIKDSEIGKSITEDNRLTMEILEEKTEIAMDARDEYFYDHILNHIRHYFQVCVDAGIPLLTAQKQLVIGTDFDGLINPFINMPTVERMKNVRTYISMNLKYYLNDFPEAKKWAAELNTDTFMEDLFYSNGFRFVKKRFEV